MTRGNQREQDRQKAQKRAAAAQKKPKESAASLAARKEKDAEVLRQKQKVYFRTHKGIIVWQVLIEGTLVEKGRRAGGG
ncbi:hypothetical protein BJ322DRAFT_1056800 [Thelephora terrestris]|uniref:Small EDRK-rich factor-like N-terminal domain-containing protein n=1 Tax=Thelephora terrestris TaxID=56493 RepID=A0A9P6L6S9_9AGAM|nr:hypothetical protein BJ322DRAFT_1056800 [Thelephora terrestris]